MTTCNRFGDQPRYLMNNEAAALPVTYDDFERYGIHRHAIAAAIRETVALGFAEITERGRAGNAEFRSPHKFRLTYFHAGRAPPTNEWQRIKTPEDAQALARAARREAPQKTKVQWRKTPNLSGGNQHRKRQFHSAETATTRLSADSTTTSISRGGGRRRPTGGAGRASQTDRRCSAFTAMSEYLSGLAPELARGGEKISAKISKKNVGSRALPPHSWNAGLSRQRGVRETKKQVVMNFKSGSGAR
jgi:hypothetical protein